MCVSFRGTSTSSPQSIHHICSGGEDAREQSVHMLSLALRFMSLLYYPLGIFRLHFFSVELYECVYLSHEAMILYCSF